MSNNLRNVDLLKKERFNEEGYPTLTSKEQIKVEVSIDDLLRLFSKRVKVDLIAPSLLRNKHASYLRNSLTHLSTPYQCLDSSRPWFCYWILHSLALLDENSMLLPDDVSKIVRFLNKCQCPEGGFGGGPGQLPHLAPTFAAVNALCILGTEEAFDAINRETLMQFLLSVRTPQGAFRMHVGGEVDVRGVYCAIQVAKLTNIFTDALFESSAEWVVSCQSYEGGFSGTPDMEAHGGYTFCGIAALALLGKEHYCDIKALLRWAVNRQMRFEGGFQGRTNKLVDGCYSFWAGGMFPIIQNVLINHGETKALSVDRWLFHQEALQEYILVCCQCSAGGLLDKPSKQRDIYHTCYCLSGLSVAQHSQAGPVLVVGNPDNEVAPVHPVYNIGYDSVVKAFTYFQNQPVPGTSA